MRWLWIAGVVSFLGACQSPNPGYPTSTPSPARPAATIGLRAASSLYSPPAPYGTPTPGKRGLVIISGEGFTPGEVLVYSVEVVDGRLVPPTEQRATASIPSGAFQVGFTLPAFYGSSCLAVFRRADGTQSNTNAFPC